LTENIVIGILIGFLLGMAAGIHLSESPDMKSEPYPCPKCNRPMILVPDKNGKMSRWRCPWESTHEKI